MPVNLKLRPQDHVEPHPCMEAFKQYWRRGGGLLLQRKSDGAVYEVHSCVEAPKGYRIKVSRQIESGTMEFETTFGLREDPLYVPMWR